MKKLNDELIINNLYWKVFLKKNSDGVLLFSDAKEFRPNMTPKEVLQAGSFGGTYFRPIKSSVTGLKYNKMWNELPQNWLEGKLLYLRTYVLLMQMYHLLTYFCYRPQSQENDLKWLQKLRRNRQHLQSEMRWWSWNVGKFWLDTGKSLPEALIFASTNPQYDDRLFIELQIQYMKIPSSEHGENVLCTEIVFDIQNNSCSPHVLQK